MNKRSKTAKYIMGQTAKGQTRKAQIGGQANYGMAHNIAEPVFRQGFCIFVAFLLLNMNLYAYAMNPSQPIADAEIAPQSNGALAMPISFAEPGAGMAFAESGATAAFAESGAGGTPAGTSASASAGTGGISAGASASASAGTSAVPTGATASFACSTSGLSDEEVQRLWDETLKKGYVGKSLESGTAEKERDMFDFNKIILTSQDTNTALLGSMPGYRVQPFEVSHMLGKYIKGAFAFGIVIDDTLRTGRCKDFATCPVVGSNLKLRNSGSSFVETTKDIASDLLDGNKYKVEGLKDKDKETISAYLAMDDNTALAESFKRIEKNIISNSIMADYFEAAMQTNCRNAGCMISTYSLFDKYFNGWFSLDMVVSIGAPTLIGLSKKGLGWFERRGLSTGWDESKIVQNMRTKLGVPGFFNDARMVRMNTRVNKFGLTEVLDDLKSPKKGYTILKTGSFSDWLSRSLDQGGSLAKLKTAKQRSEMVKAAGEIVNFGKHISAISKTSKANLATAVKQFGANSQEALRARLIHAQTNARMMWQIDAQMGLDLPEMWMRLGQTNLYPYSLKNVLTKETQNFTSEAKYIRDNVLKPFFEEDIDTFYKAGKRWQGGVFETDELGNLKLFVPGDREFIGKVDKSKLEDLLSQYTDVMVRLDTGKEVLLSPANMANIQEHTTGLVEAYSLKSMKYSGQTLTPEKLAGTLTDGYVDSRVTKLAQNGGTVLNTLIERGWESRRYGSLLDKAIAEETELLKTYFGSLKGAAKWTALPYAYWYGKRGFGLENFSAYQLPKTWRSIEFKPGEETIYDDAFIDFFANEGSDQGDLFIKLINKLPWKVVLNAAVEAYKPLEKNWSKFTKQQELRDKVENLAVYVSGPNECSGCSVNLRTNNLEDFSPAFVSPMALKTYITEDVVTDEAKKIGRTLIGFSHHTNLDGISEAGEKKMVDLVQARKDKETCADKINDLHISGWFPIGRFIPKSLQGPEIGMILAFTETIGYFAFGFSGIIGSAVQQFVIAPQLKDCVDDEQGYFVHFFVPAKDEKEQSKPELSLEGITQTIKEGTDKFFDSFRGDENSLTREAVEKMKSALDKFAATAEDDDIVQARLTTAGTATGGMKGKELFFFWCQPGCEMMASEYTTQGKMDINSSDGNTLVSFDYKDGVLYVNGRPVLINPDAVRLSAVDARIPATVIPQNLTKISVPDSEEVLFEINTSGDAFVKDDEVLDCIRQGVIDQTGLDLAGNNLKDAFGNVENIATDTHPLVKPMPDKIVAEGIPRKIAEGADALVNILANKRVVLSKSIDSDPDLGKLRSVQFKNGSIVYKPETNELIVWLRHHEEAILSQNDAKTLKADLTQTKNPLTDCVEPAINLSVLANPESQLASHKAEQFNTSLEHMGPFQIFDTDTKRFIIYSKLLPTGECQDYFKVIDKETGKVLVDQPIESIAQTPTGVKIVTADGKEHNLDFSSENGRPVLTYNGVPETLRSAAGRNGSFWYDPDKGLWYAENGQLLPLLDAFRQQGILTQAHPDGTVGSKPGGNFMNVNLGSDQGLGFNLPSLPENLLLLLLFLASLMAAIVMARARIMRRYE